MSYRDDVKKLYVPAIPKEIYDSLCQVARSYSGNFLTWKIHVGDTVKQGQELAAYQVKSFKAHHAFRGKITTQAVIKAPANGIILSINPIECMDWNKEQYETMRKNSNGDGGYSLHSIDKYDRKDVLFSMIVGPRQDIPTCYGVYEDIVDYRYFANSNAESMFSFFTTGAEFSTALLERLANARIEVTKDDGSSWN